MATRFVDQDFFPNFYERLGLERTASATEIARAYRKRAMETHPDSNLDDVENATKQFVAIGRAYEVLKNPEDKRSYDMALRIHSPKADHASDNNADPKPDFTRPEFYTDFSYTDEEVRRYKEASDRIAKDEYRQGDLGIVFNFVSGGSRLAPEQTLLPEEIKLIK